MSERLHVRYDRTTRDAILMFLADEAAVFPTLPGSTEADVILDASVTELTKRVPWTATRVTASLDGLEINVAKLPPESIDVKRVATDAVARAVADVTVPKSIKDALVALREAIVR